MIRALTGYSTRNPWKVILIWVLLGITLTGVSGTLMYRVTQTQTGDFLPRGYDSAAALRIAEERFGVKPDANAVTVLVARTDGAKLGEADQRKIAASAEKLAHQRVVTPKLKDDAPAFLGEDYSQTPSVQSLMLAPDGRFQLLSAGLVGNSLDPALQRTFKAFRDSARAEFAAQGLRTGFTGGLADSVDAADADEVAGKITGALVMALIVLLNVLVFRGVLAAILPLIAVTLIGGAASGAVIGIAMLTGVKLDPGTPMLIQVVLIGIGVDYLIFLLFRFRERLRARPEADRKELAGETAGRVGTAITSAALTIVAAFATLGVASFGQFRVLGPAIAVSVLVMLLGSLTLMPALLAVCGRKMFWPSRALMLEPRPGVAARLADLVTRRPVLAALGSLALLAALAAGVIGIRMDYGFGSDGPKTAATATAAEISRALPAGVSDPTTVYVTAKDSARPLDGPAGLDGLERALGAVPGVGKVGATTLSPDHRAARIDLYLTADQQSQQARDLVAGPLRAAVAAHTPAGLTAHLGGTAAIFTDVATVVDHDLRIVFPVAAALIALILFMLLRSLLAPAVLLISVGLCFAATLGASTLVFQHAAGNPGVAFTLPLVLFLFVVALGTDYNILITDRIREEMARPGSARSAVARALRHTAPAIATAALVLAGSFAALGATPASRQVGFATALGILLSAFLLSMVLVPAVATLLGRSIWWPLRPRSTPEPAAPPREPAHAARY
ncbi:multidrug transporter [Kitasatospora sp. MMS16-BH015]|uniref:MMPL family transporter n=1 Tax=Kitasatospora sp. MMS16-BH015 TaxID=2018025 RepID=UPI000CA24C2D|nr:MMPL family transporter [Kitasatospora sp. MMS16-BH015]AUG75958.1 multidrug transporter [Kitasatospora sp. MMS16-BH015]